MYWCISFRFCFFCFIWRSLSRLIVVLLKFCRDGPFGLVFASWAWNRIKVHCMRRRREWSLNCQFIGTLRRRGAKSFNPSIRFRKRLRTTTSQKRREQYNIYAGITNAIYHQPSLEPNLLYSSNLHSLVDSLLNPNLASGRSFLLIDDESNEIRYQPPDRVNAIIWGSGIADSIGAKKGSRSVADSRCFPLALKDMIWAFLRSSSRKTACWSTRSIQMHRQTSSSTVSGPVEVAEAGGTREKGNREAVGAGGGNRSWEWDHSDEKYFGKYGLRRLNCFWRALRRERASADACHPITMDGRTLRGNPRHLF